MGYPVAYRRAALSPRLSTGAANTSRGPVLRLPISQGSAALYQLPRPPVPAAARPYGGFAGPVGSFGGEYAPARPAPRPAPSSWKPPLPGSPAPPPASALRLAGRMVPFVGWGFLLADLIRLYFAWLWSVLFGAATWQAAGWTVTTCAGAVHVTRAGAPGTIQLSCGSRLFGVQPSHVDWMAPYTGTNTGAIGFQLYGPTGFIGSTPYKPASGWLARPAGVTTTAPVATATYAVQGAQAGSLAQLAPELVPLGVPVALPGAVPALRPGPAWNPYAMPGQVRVGGYALPGAAPTGYRGWPRTEEFTWGRAGRPSVRKKPAPKRKRPGRKEKEKKGAVQKALVAVMNAGFALTEAMDLIEALLEALPEGHRWRYREGHGSAAIQKVQHLWNEFDHVDPAKAINNVIQNQIEDKIIGWINQKGQKGVKNLGGTATGINTGASGLPDAPFIP